MEEFTPLEVRFLAEAASLPEEYANLMLPPLDEGLRIPCKNPAVGDIVIRFFKDNIHIQVGDHTSYSSGEAGEAAWFLRDILTDETVFHLQEGGVEIFRAVEFESLSEADWTYHVWSGPFAYSFLNKRGRGRFKDAENK